VRDLESRNVVIIPPKSAGESTPVFETALAWSKAVSEWCGAEFALDETHYLPHASLYQAAYPSSALAALTEAVRAIAAASTPFEVVTGGLDTFWGTFLFWDMRKSAELTDLHRRCLEKLNPLRDDLLLSVQQKILRDLSVSESLRSNVRRYGHPLCGKDERPHITISRLREARNTPRAVRMLENHHGAARTRFHFLVDRIYLTLVGPHGTCPGPLHEFPFGS
jgi:2'-5' RNA ligase